MKSLFVYVLMIFFGFSAKGQMLMPQVLASAGDYFVNTSGNAALSFTVGEMTMVETFQAQGNILTQGFHQPEFVILAIQDEDLFNEFVVYPNPASNFINVRYRMKYSGDLGLKLVDMQGVTVWQKASAVPGGIEEIQDFSVQHLSQGMYFLQVTYFSSSRNLETISHHKIEIVR